MLRERDYTWEDRKEIFEKLFYDVLRLIVRGNSCVPWNVS
jgi:hypothetical protein